jgi:hypothetical protein
VCDDTVIKKLFMMTIILCAVFFTASRASSEADWDLPRYDDETADQHQGDSDLWNIAKEIRDGFSYTFRWLGYGTVQSPSSSSMNPGNNIFQLPDYTLNLELRPDLYLNWRRINLLVKPRVVLSGQHWGAGHRAGESDFEDDWYVNEWLFRFRLVEGLFVSYGRENLQWGPSFLVSPSNPFYANNGQANPRTEVPGMDFARLVWVPSLSWTASLIANVGKGEQDFFGEFQPGYAFKLDYTTYKKYASLILSHRESEGDRLGAFAGWAVSDALLLHAEGAIFRGNQLYYLEKAAAGQIPQLSFLTEGKDSLEGMILFGGSYTFEAGITLAMEYVYTSAGFSDDDVDLFFEVIRAASQIPYPQDLIYNPALDFGGKTLGPNFKLMRKNYLMLQYSQSQIWNLLDLGCRYTYNIDDGSSQLIVTAGYYVGDHAQLFVVGNQNFGPKDTEFRALFDYSWMFGIQYTF